MRKITEDDFTITSTKSGKTVRWKHNNRACATFRTGSPLKRAKGYIKFLVDWYSNEGYVLTDLGERFIVEKGAGVK